MNEKSRNFSIISSHVVLLDVSLWTLIFVTSFYSCKTIKERTNLIYGNNHVVGDMRWIIATWVQLLLDFYFFAKAKKKHVNWGDACLKWIYIYCPSIGIDCHCLYDLLMFVWISDGKRMSWCSWNLLAVLLGHSRKIISDFGKNLIFY